MGSCCLGNHLKYPVEESIPSSPYVPTDIKDEQDKIHSHRSSISRVQMELTADDILTPAEIL